MIRHRFVVNLRESTFCGAFRQGLSPPGYLLPPDESAVTVKRAADVRKARLRLYCDNGNFASIGRLRARFAPAGAAILAEVARAESRLGHLARAGELEPKLSERIAAFAREVEDAANEAIGDDAGRLQAQLRFSPSHVIGVENLAPATWLSLNIEPDYLAGSRAHCRSINTRTARRAATMLEVVPRELRARYYAVASAMSYDTAFDAGRVFARHGLARIAMGFGAYMADDNYTDHVVIRGRVVGLTAKLPNRYLRTALAARGFWDGYVAAAGKAPDGFHFLGLGAPIMIGIAAVAGSETPDLSFDATSPIKDASEGMLYCSKPAFLKIRTRGTAYRLASRAGERWRCPCPFCREYCKAHPFDYAAGRAWYAAGQPGEVSAGDLAPGGALFEAYPLLGEPADRQARKAVDFARMGHNHWMVNDIVNDLNRHCRTGRDLAAHMHAVVGKYCENTTPVFATAVRLALDIASGTLPH